MKLLTHPRLVQGRTFIDKHHRQWVGGKTVEICLTRELSNKFAVISEGFSVAPQSWRNVFYCSTTLLLLLSLQICKSIFVVIEQLYIFNLSLKARTNR